MNTYTCAMYVVSCVLPPVALCWQQTAEGDPGQVVRAVAGVEGGVDGRRGTDDEAGQGRQRRNEYSLGNSRRSKGSQDHG